MHGPGESVDGVAFIQGNAEFGSRHRTPRLLAKAPPKRAEAGDVLVSVRAPVGALNVAAGELGIGRGIAAECPGPALDDGFSEPLDLSGMLDPTR